MMPFELLPEESKKMTINCEIMNALIDIWETEMAFGEALDHLDNLEMCQQFNLNIDEEDREHLDNMYKALESFSWFEEFINKQLDRYGCREVIERKREIPHDI